MSVEINVTRSVSEVKQPAYCPTCGNGVEVVRHIEAHVFELYCERCETPFVVLVNDFVKLEGGP